VQKTSKVKVHVGSLVDMGKRFTSAWNKAAAGKKVDETHITFRGLQTMLEPFSEKLTDSRRASGISIRCGQSRVYAAGGMSLHTLLHTVSAAPEPIETKRVISIVPTLIRGSVRSLSNRTSSVRIAGPTHRQVL